MVLCALADLADGQALPFEAGDAADPLPIIVARRGDTVHAYLNRCPHFQIPLNVGRGINTFRHHLLCANHYAVFRFEDGYCIDGPCMGSSLTAVPIEISAGRVTFERD